MYQHNLKNTVRQSDLFAYSWSTQINGLRHVQGRERHFHFQSQQIKADLIWSGDPSGFQRVAVTVKRKHHNSANGSAAHDQTQSNLIHKQSPVDGRELYYGNDGRNKNKENAL